MSGKAKREYLVSGRKSLELKKPKYQFGVLLNNRLGFFSYQQK